MQNPFSEAPHGVSLEHIIKEEWCMKPNYKIWRWICLWMAMSTEFQDHRLDLALAINCEVMGCPHNLMEILISMAATDKGSQPQQQYWAVYIRNRHIWVPTTALVHWANLASCGTYSLMSGGICICYHRQACLELIRTERSCHSWHPECSSKLLS